MMDVGTEREGGDSDVTGGGCRPSGLGMGRGSTAARRGSTGGEMQNKEKVYKMMQRLLPLPPRVGRLRSAARVAYWKTSRTPSFVLAEHSR